MQRIWLLIIIELYVYSKIFEALSLWSEISVPCKQSNFKISFFPPGYKSLFQANYLSEILRPLLLRSMPPPETVYFSNTHVVCLPANGAPTFYKNIYLNVRLHLTSYLTSLINMSTIKKK